MKIDKILNNNVITSIDDKTSVEKVVMGRGIGFKKKIGDEVDEDKVEKVFILQNQNENEKFQRLINELPIEYVDASEKIISYAKEKLDASFDDHIYIALTDHLAFAIKRAKMGVKIENHLLWEIQRIHKREYEIGLWAVEFISRKFNIDLNEDEAGFIALHLVNAFTGDVMNNTMNITRIVQDMLNIIKYSYKIDFTPKDISYDRLVTHLKYFTQRVISKKELREEDNAFLDIIMENYKEAYLGALKIKSYIEKNFDYKVSQGEVVYLSLHLERVLSSLRHEEYKKEENNGLQQGSKTNC